MLGNITLVSFLLTVLGILLLLLSLAGIGFGSFMMLDWRTREPGMFFALWWVTGVAAAWGIFMRDPVTFSIGVFCFVVAGIAMALEHRGSRSPSRGGETGSGNAGKPTLLGRAKSRFSGWMKAWEYRKIS